MINKQMIRDNMEKIFNKLNKIEEDIKAKGYSIRMDIGPLRDEIKVIDGIDHNVRMALEEIKDISYKIDALQSDRIDADHTLAAVVLIPYRGVPTVIKDGKKINCENVSHISLDYYSDERIPKLEIER